MPRRIVQVPPLPEVLVTDEASLRACVSQLAKHTVLGFDTEFVGEHTYRPELCLIQVSTTERLYLIDPYNCGSLEPFWQLMHDPARAVLAHAAREETRMCYFQSGTAPANIFDTQIAAGFLGLTYPMSYAGLVQTVLGVKLNKGDTLSDWRRRPLSSSQIRYAYDDVRYLIPIYTRLLAKLKKFDRVSWAEDEFRTFVGWATGEVEVVERWRKVKGSGGLRRRELAVLRAAFAWREGVAVRQDRPARTVLRDDMLIEVARRGAKKHDIAELRGLPQRELPVLEKAVDDANQLPMNQCPKETDNDVDPPQVGIISVVLNVVLSDLCERLKLATGLVCTQQDLKDLVRARQPGCGLPPDSPFQLGWRKTDILPHLARVLDGNLALRVQDPRTTAPLEYIELVDG